MASRIGAIATAVLCLGPMALHDARADAPGRWAGAYVGLYAGYAFGRAEATEPFDSNTGFFYNITGRPYGFDSNGPLAGVISMRC